MNILDIYALPEFYEQAEFMRTTKSALVVQEDVFIMDELKFYENVCINRGYNIKIFLNLDEGLKWLLDNE